MSRHWPADVSEYPLFRFCLLSVAVLIRVLSETFTKLLMAVRVLRIIVKTLEERKKIKHLLFLNSNAHAHFNFLMCPVIKVCELPLEDTTDSLYTIFTS
jgi:hypothetical protein